MGYSWQPCSWYLIVIISNCYYFETNRFFTDPTKIDTDDDGASDKDEIFYYRTDPTQYTTEFPAATPTPNVNTTMSPTPTDVPAESPIPTLAPWNWINSRAFEYNAKSLDSIDGRWAICSTTLYGETIRALSTNVDWQTSSCTDPPNTA